MESCSLQRRPLQLSGPHAGGSSIQLRMSAESSGEGVLGSNHANLRSATGAESGGATGGLTGCSAASAWGARPGVADSVCFRFLITATRDPLQPYTTTNEPDDRIIEEK